MNQRHLILPEDRPDQWRFVHIPKNAGSSYRHTYPQGVHLHPCTINGVHITKLPPHTPATEFPKDFFTFAIIRNPLDRAVSICAYILRGLKTKLTPAMFQDWVADGFPTEIAKLGQPILQAGYVVDSLKLLITAPQTAYLRHDTHIVRYEFLDRDLPPVLDLLGVPYASANQSNPIRSKTDLSAAGSFNATAAGILRVYHNFSNRLHNYQPYYNDLTKLRVQRKFETDYTTLGDLWR